MRNSGRWFSGERNKRLVILECTRTFGRVRENFAFDRPLCEPGRSKHTQQAQSRFVFVRMDGIERNPFRNHLNDEPEESFVV